MYKRFLAILAIVTTVFAFGVGAAMADRPEDKGPKKPVPACEKEDGPECENGRPVKGNDDDNGGEGGQPEPQDLCDAIRELHDDLAPVAEACDTIVGQLPGGETDPDPDPQPQPGPQDLCTGIRDGGGAPIADVCDQIVGQLPA